MPPSQPSRPSRSSGSDSAHHYPDHARSYPYSFLTNGSPTQGYGEPQDLAFQHQGSWAGGTLKYGDLDAEPYYGSPGTTPVQSSYHQQRIPLHSQTYAPHLDVDRSARRSDPANAPPSSRPPTHRDHASHMLGGSHSPSHQFIPNPHPRTHTEQAANNDLTPTTLEEYNEYVHETNNMHLMLQQDYRVEPYYVVAYTGQDGRGLRREFAGEQRPQANVRRL